MTLLLNQDLFYPGDPFDFRVRVENPNTRPFGVDEYVLLDVWGEYYFWPSWGQEIDKKFEEFLPGETQQVILSFTWPRGAGEADGLAFWGAIFLPGSFDLLSYGYVSFGFREPTQATPTPTPRPTSPPGETPTATPSPGGGPYEYEVPGTVPWMTTGLFVEEGETWRLVADGEICFHRGDCAGTTVGPCGLEEECFDAECATQPYTPPFRHGALIARIGAQGHPFLICDEYAWPMTGTGELFLGINDGNCADNDGAFRVIIYPPE